MYKYFFLIDKFFMYKYCIDVYCDIKKIQELLSSSHDIRVMAFATCELMAKTSSLGAKI